MDNYSFLLRQISFSSEAEFRACERKYQLDKLTYREQRDEEGIDETFGHAVAAGIQDLWLTSSLDSALAACFFAWKAPFADKIENSKKSICYAHRAVEAFLPFYSILSRDWELAFYKGKPCIEFSLKIELPNGFNYRAYADLCLRNKETKELAVIEIKTTGLTWEHEAQFKNSDQGTSYVLTVDQLAPDATSFWVKYLVYYTKSKDPNWVVYDFPKTLINKARWLKTIMRDIKDIQRCEEEDYFPMRGGNCMAFGRPCKYFDICQLQDRALFSSDELLEKKVEIEKKMEYSFIVPIEQIVKTYLR